MENIYAAICECQTLYPDPELSDDSEEEIIERQENGDWDEDEDEDEGGVFYTSAEEGLPHLSAEGRVSNQIYILNMVGCNDYSV